jgi:polysaccharide biosynthesis protein PslH
MEPGEARDSTLGRRRRILYISHAPPVPGRVGPGRRNYHVLEQLARFYDVHFLSVGDGSEGPLFEQIFGDRVRSFAFAARRAGVCRKYLRKIVRTLTGRCDFLPAHEPSLRALCAQMTSAHSFDAIVLSSVLLRALPLPENVPIIGDTHNAEFDVLRRTAELADGFLLRQYARWQCLATRAEEQRCGRRVDLLLATSERDREMFERDLGLDNVAVIPNGVDLAEFARRPKPEVRPTILFSGLMSYDPNQQAVAWFLDHVLGAVRRSVPAARFVVAGAAPPRWLRVAADNHIEVTGWVPDIRPYLERAAVVVAPLLIGGGTRVKILEALAMAKPVVSTSLGAEGLKLTHGESVLLADDPESFAQNIVNLLLDADLAARIARNGYAHVARYFEWDQIGVALNALLATRMAPTAPVASAAAYGRPLVPQMAQS